MIKKLCLGTAKIGIPNYGYSRTGIILNVDQFLTNTFSLGIKNLDNYTVYTKFVNSIDDIKRFNLDIESLFIRLRHQIIND